MRVAAVQLEPVVGDLRRNLEQSERLVDAAAAEGAELIVLPEFFTTGMAFMPELAGAALAPGGAATDLLERLARRHDTPVGGSFLCRDADGHARNAFQLVSPQGDVKRHNKDIPTMWENCFYVGGTDDGVVSTMGIDAGVALCWELMRSRTVHRLRGRVDIVLAGSCWWSIPDLPPRWLTRRRERANNRRAREAVTAFARHVGAPVVHAAHCGEVESAMPWLPVRYRGHYEGETLICDARGRTLARRAAADGPGVAVAEIEPRRTQPAQAPPRRFWLHRRDPLAAAVWAYQRAHGRRWYRRNAFGRPPADGRVPAEGARGERLTSQRLG